MTFTRDQKAVDAITRVMLESHEALVDYMTPLGLHHIMWGGHHYGPAPWWDKEKRDDWNPTYYHRADERGLGFDRTKTGSHSVSQYHPPVRDSFANLSACPEKFLVWFHHVPWDHRARDESCGKNWRCIISAAWIGCEPRARSGARWPARSTRNVTRKGEEVGDSGARRSIGATPACSTFPAPLPLSRRLYFVESSPAVRCS